jgi:pimeloyl-ACP methyl ester carboxylesterase
MNSVDSDMLDTATDGTIESLNTTVNGSKAHYLKAGNGPPVILFHGGASDSRDWLDTMAALANSYTVHAPDMIGFGQSDRSKPGYYLSDFAEFAAGFINELGYNSQALVGHSLGGRVCLEIALQHPEKVRQLVLVDTVGFGRLARWGMYIGAFMYWLRKGLRMPQPYPRYLKHRHEDNEWMCLDMLPELKPPTLLVWNERDPYYSVSQATRAARLIPDARLEIFPGYGHAPHMKSRERFNSLLLDFLKDHS